MDRPVERSFPRWAGGLIALIIILAMWLAVQFRREEPLQTGPPAATGTSAGAPHAPTIPIPVMSGSQTVTASAETPAGASGATGASGPATAHVP